MKRTKVIECAVRPETTEDERNRKKLFDLMFDALQEASRRSGISPEELLAEVKRQLNEKYGWEA